MKAQERFAEPLVGGIPFFSGVPDLREGKAGDRKWDGVDTTPRFDIGSPDAASGNGKDQIGPDDQARGGCPMGESGLNSSPVTTDGKGIIDFAGGPLQGDQKMGAGQVLLQREGAAFRRSGCGIENADEALFKEQIPTEIGREAGKDSERKIQFSVPDLRHHSVPAGLGDDQVNAGSDLPEIRKKARQKDCCTVVRHPKAKGALLLRRCKGTGMQYSSDGAEDIPDLGRQIKGAGRRFEEGATADQKGVAKQTAEPGQRMAYGGLAAVQA